MTNLVWKKNLREALNKSLPTPKNRRLTTVAVFRRERYRIRGQGHLQNSEGDARRRNFRISDSILKPDAQGR